MFFRKTSPSLTVPALAPIAGARRGLSTAQILRAVLMLAGATALGLMASATRARAESIIVAQAGNQAGSPAGSRQETSFAAFIAGLWPEARAAGVSRATFNAAFAGVTPNPQVVALTRKQSEFVRPIWHYIDNGVTEGRTTQGRAMAREWTRTLAKASSMTGVDSNIVLAIWGMETNFGSYTGRMSVIRSLATLAHTGYRGDFFRRQLVIALQILEQGHITPAAMTGSWAGAMGQTQFMPSSFMEHAVDFDGDGHKNIWTSVPDALGSTASYLAHNGWQRGLPWGFEVLLPRNFRLGPQDQSLYSPFAGWQAHGLRRADGRPLPRAGEAMLYLPAGMRGPAFLVTRNFQVIKSYNTSSSYALAVALLSDRIAGGSGLVGAWPRKDKMLDTAEAKELQRHLRRLGHDAGEIDGRLGEKARNAIIAWQVRNGMQPEGYATRPLLERMRGAR